MPHTPQEQQELPASFWTGLEFSKLHICPAAPSQGLLRATLVPLWWELTWSKVHTQCKVHPKQYKQDSHSQGPFTSRACRVPRVAVCLEGCFLGFQAISVEFQRGLKDRLSSVPAELQIPTLVPTTCHLCLLHFPTEMGTLNNNSYLQLLRRAPVRVSG